MNLQNLHQNLLEAAKQKNFEIEVILQKEPVNIVAFIKKSPSPKAPTIYLSAGIHGDEPAGPFAVIKLLEEGFFDNTINWYIIPILNPTGLKLGTRENKEGLDLNRDYKLGKTPEVTAHLEWFKKYQNIVFDLSICLHEDWEYQGFYAYAILPSKYMRLLPEIVQTVEKISPINLENEIEGRPAKGGFIIHFAEEVQDFINKRDDWPEAFFLMKQQMIPFHFTFETASSQPINQRVDAHCAAIKSTINGFIKTNKT